MSTQVKAAPVRRKSNAAWVPRQHGAWAMLIVPWLIGALLRAKAGPANWATELLLLISWVAAYLWFNSASLWLKAAPRRRPRYAPAVLTYAALVGALGLLVLLLGAASPWWGIGFAPLLLIALELARRRRDRSLLSGLVTVAAAALLGLVARYPSPAWPDPVTSAGLTATLAYFAGTVIFVKTMIRERGQRSWLVGSIAAHALVAVGFGGFAVFGGPPALPWLAAFFGLATARAALLPALASTRTVRPAAVGLIELGMCVLLVLACLLP